jgi:hypothetical protein
MIGTLVGDVVQMRLLGVEWKDSQLALKALALDRVLKCIEHEEAENDQTIDANWISGYGKVLRTVSTANGGLHQQFVNQYVEKGTLPLKMRRAPLSHWLNPSRQSGHCLR